MNALLNLRYHIHFSIARSIGHSMQKIKLVWHDLFFISPYWLLLLFYTHTYYLLICFRVLHGIEVKLIICNNLFPLLTIGITFIFVPSSGIMPILLDFSKITERGSKRITISSFTTLGCWSRVLIHDRQIIHDTWFPNFGFYFFLFSVY